MSKNKTNRPKLEQRTNNSCYTFRTTINGKREVINTRTNNLSEAKEFRDNYFRGEGAIALAVQQGENTFRLANSLAKTINGEGLTRLTFDEALDFWEKHTPCFNDNTPSYQKQMKNYFKRFASWCQAEGMLYLEDVDNSAATRYHAKLRNDKYTIKTVNENLKFLARVFHSINAFRPLPNRNPFDTAIIKPSSTPRTPEATHLPLEPEMIDAVMREAATVGQIWLDVFVVAMQTGMRLKDAALFKWDMIKEGFIEFCPEKTIRYGNKVRLPISPLLYELLKRRKENNFSIYVNPEIAEFYNKSDWVTKNSKMIFERALGKENTQLDKTSRQRKRNGCIRSFHSFRVTFMSLLAAKQVPLRDAMVMLGWESVEMIQLYSKMLEAAKGDMDRRNQELLSSMPELNISLPQVEVVIKELKPTKEALEMLIPQYSNRTIGLIYNISDVAVKKWMVKYQVIRNKLVVSSHLSEAEIENIRQKLQAA